MNNIQKYKADFEALVKRGEEIMKDLTVRHNSNQALQTLTNPNIDYQPWYTEAHALINQLLSGRLEEFEQIYKGDGTGRYQTIQEWLNGHLAHFSGVENNVLFSIIRQFQNQLNILKSVATTFESTLFDIKQLVQADLFDSELDAARELANRGFVRAAGSVAGVVLEKHLGQVAENHKIKTRKKNATISDFNDLLKNDGILDIPSWRQVQRLGDIRNLCDHNKGREPTKEEVEELIDGVDKHTKTLF